MHTRTHAHTLLLAYSLAIFSLLLAYKHTDFLSIAGGWLEFLVGVPLGKSATFDREAEQRRLR